MKILLNDPPRARVEGNTGFVSIERLLAESDIITLHVPLNRTGDDKTFHLINKATLGSFKDNSWLINSSRGEVVDENDLKHALSAGRLSGAILDVWENEPDIDINLLHMTAIATPHIAGYSTDGKKNGTVQVVRSLGRHFGFPVTKWEPTGIPEPSEPVIQLNCQDRSTVQLLRQAILHTYDAIDDDVRFRSNPMDFKGQRGNYPVRREFPAYKAMLLNCSTPTKNMLAALGFQVVDIPEKY
jgi:erythronate-4-phosphate dehydrogenase